MFLKIAYDLKIQSKVMFTHYIHFHDFSEFNFPSFSEILSKVDEQILKKDYGRLFAVLMIDKHQHKLTDGDLLMVLRDLGASLG